MSSVQKQCLKSWKKHLPNYEFKLWDETNTNLKHPFIDFAYKNKKWAFVSDLVRLEVLYQEGGIYLDTDMLLFRSLDPFLKDSCFFGAEDENYISCGIIGAVPSHPFIGECIREYDNFLSDRSLIWKNWTIPKLVTRIFNKKCVKINGFGTKVDLPNLTIYPAIYFYSLSYSERWNKVRKKKHGIDEVYAIHLWEESWIDLDSNLLLRKRKFFKAIRKFSTELFYKKNYNLHFFLTRLKTLKKVLNQ